MHPRAKTSLLFLFAMFPFWIFYNPDNHKDMYSMEIKGLISERVPHFASQKAVGSR
jgi:hypothetical protein